MAMATSPSLQSAIEAATKRHGSIFAGYIALLVITALAVAFFTWLERVSKTVPHRDPETSQIEEGVVDRE